MKYEIANWLTPGLTPMRMVFTTFGGSAHGTITVESQDIESGTWSHVIDVTNANGVPRTVGEEVGTEHINRFTGEVTQ